MSESELQEQFIMLDNLVDHQELTDELQSLGELQEEEEAAPVKTPEKKGALEKERHWWKHCLCKAKIKQESVK